MITWIARREILEHVRSPRFIVVSLLCVMLLPATTYVNVSRLRDREQFAQELIASRDLASDRRAADDNGASRFGWRSGIVAPDAALRAVRRPVSQEVLAAGVSGNTPAFWQFSTEGAAPGPTADTDAHSSTAVAMDAASVVQTILGLLAVLIAFDSVSGELESGRMRTVLAHPVARTEVLAGKFVGAYVTLMAPLAAGMGVTILVIAARGLPLFEPHFLTATLGLLCAASLYIATMLAIGVAVSAITREARTSLVALLVIWICATLAVPGGAALTSAALSPVQPIELTRASIMGNIRLLERERATRLAEVWNVVSGSRVVPADGTIAADLRNAYLLASERIEQQMVSRKRAVIQNLEGERDRQLARRSAIEQRIGWLSPAVTFTRAAESLGGTGAAAEMRWMADVAREQAALEAATFDRRYGLELFAAELGYQRITFWPSDSDMGAHVPEYADLPAFAHHSQGIMEAITDAAPNLCLLALECVGMLTIASFAYARIDV